MAVVDELTAMRQARIQRRLAGIVGQTRAAALASMGTLEGSEEAALLADIRSTGQQRLNQLMQVIEHRFARQGGCERPNPLWCPSRCLGELQRPRLGV